MFDGLAPSIRERMALGIRILHLDPAREELHCQNLLSKLGELVALAGNL